LCERRHSARHGRSDGQHQSEAQHSRVPFEPQGTMISRGSRANN
jgi:hypothetical protein